ncbi:MAG: ATP-dependent Clp protease adapter ClpS [Candidatus Endonucleobacter bathymodioli]|uniref:ATP-dependent Clp protease adapter protein ClpS n=1 Tax=Candidatus Endonucleibacter bathymodioli TaxID=539814 RepID=A0AA90NVR6_9GAMM|nr:ATP-dependent Clp protease adapter ClpS [Candidatus Endonucleobacter bathymodioli]
MSNLKRFSLNLGSEGCEKEGDQDLSVIPEKTRLIPPSMYQVLLLNDDFTPMDFVVDVLGIFFDMPTEKAAQIMLTVHTKGKASCGIFSKDVAETKAQQVNQYSRDNQHPLLCKTEKAN